MLLRRPQGSTAPSSRLRRLSPDRTSRRSGIPKRAESHGRFPRREAGAGTAGHRPPAALGQAGSEETPRPTGPVVWVPGHPAASPAGTLTPHRGGLSVREVQRPPAQPGRRRWAPSRAQLGRGVSSGRSAVSRRAGRRRDQAGCESSAMPPGPVPALVGGAFPNPTKSPPHSPLAGVRRVHLLLLRRHSRRRRRASAGPRLPAG